MHRRQTLFELVGRHARDRGASPAILAPGRTLLTYGELYQCLQRAGAALAAAGLGRGARIALALPDGPDLAVATLAAMSFATCAPLDPALDQGASTALLVQLRIDALVVPADCDSPLTAAARALGLPIVRLAAGQDAAAGDFTLHAETARAAVAPSPGRPDDIALLLQTSGTTATPKIVPLDHGQLAFTALLLPLEPADRALCVSPLFWYGPLSVNLFSPLAQGASAVFTGGFDHRSFRDWLDAFAPTFYGASPTIQASILDVLPPRLSTSLRFVRASSKALPPAMQQRLEAVLEVPVLQGYGMTECGLIAANPMAPGRQRLGSVGIAQGIEIELRDETGRPVAQGSTGEVTVRGPGVMRGYDGDSARNSDVLVDGWFRTGDLGHFDADGYLYLSGRIKELINRGGQKFSPQEVDAVFMRHAAVREAVTFALPHPSLGEDVATAVVLHEPGSVNAAALRGFAVTQLLPYKVPSSVLLVGDLPRNAAGKVDRHGLADFLRPALEPDVVAPRTHDEALVAAVFAEVLALARVGALDNFFHCGGDSLRAAQVVARLHARTGVGLDLRALFEAPTVEQLAIRFREVAMRAPGSPVGRLAPVRHRRQALAPPLLRAEE
jgi:acyl-CoA synthetase (AMP-forming)/AMP-acid ligase II/aryl carrier-like protein